MNKLLNQKQFVNLIKDTYGMAKARDIHKRAYAITCERKPAFKECNPEYHGKHIAIPIEILAECIGLSIENFNELIKKATHSPASNSGMPN